MSKRRNQVAATYLSVPDESLECHIRMCIRFQPALEVLTDSQAVRFYVFTCLQLVQQARQLFLRLLLRAAVGVPAPLTLTVGAATDIDE
ncbi:MAG: hypothetical protein ACR2KU_05785 [Gammaproteobacteria bacterium]